MSSPAFALAGLLQLLDEAFDRKAWHGSTLRGSIRRVEAAQAAWRPAPDRHSIVDIVRHSAYWKYVTRRRLTGEKRGSFPLKGSNWFPSEDRLSPAAWDEAVALLEDQHAQLRAVVAELSPRQIAGTPPGSTVSNVRQIFGIAYHDVYHTGQIQTLKSLFKGRA